MRHQDILIGGRYHAKVGGRVATVVVLRCLGQQWSNRWKYECVTEDTKRRIKATGQRLRPLPTGPHVINDGEWLGRLQPAVEEYRLLIEAKKDAANAKAGRENRDLAASARKAGVTKQKLRSKLTRLKGLMQHDEGMLLALELIKDADPWLLQALTAGTVVRRGEDVDGHPMIEWEPGAVFRSLFKGSSEKDAFWETNHAQSPFWIPFWLAVVRATDEKVCPDECRLEDLWRFQAGARNEGEFATLVGDIVPAMTGVQELELYVGGFQVSTARLPDLPLLSRLIFHGISDQSAYVLVVETLERFPELKGVVLHDFVRLNLAADQENHFQHVRLETCQGVCQEGADGLRKLDKPPETYRCVVDTNVSGARVLLSMARDYSGRDNAPRWWNPGWVSRKWWRTAGYYKGQTKYGRLAWPRHGKVDLSLCQVLTPEILELVNNAEVPVVLPTCGVLEKGDDRDA